MSFFGPPPTPPREPFEMPPWGPPLWDRPAEDTLGVSVGMSVLLARSEEDALVFEDVCAYPNGFTFGLVTIRNPNLPVEMDRPRMPFGRLTRIGFTFADGATVSSDESMMPMVPLPGMGGPGHSSTATLVSVAGGAGGAERARPGFDADGIPTGHVLRPQGGGGSQYRQTMGFWCFRLPAAGPMTIHADVPGKLDEVSVEVDASVIVEAATRSQLLWERTDDA